MSDKTIYHAGLEAVTALVDNIREKFAPLSHKHTKSDITDLTVDSALSSTSNNPVQNKVVNTAIDEQANALSTHTGNSDIHFSATERTKLSDIESGAQKNTVTGIKGGAESSYRTGQVNITKANIGLGNAENTADKDKIVSDFQRAAIDQAESDANSYTDTKVKNMVGTSTVSAQISSHNTSTASHSDIRELIDDLQEDIDNISSGTTVVKEATHASTATNATNANHASTSDSATIADTATKAMQDGNGNVIIDTYETKSNAKSNYDALLAEAQSAEDNANTYTDNKIKNMIGTSTVATQISSHNTSTSAHGDIRDLITGLTNRLNAVANSTDADLDTLSEIVVYIKSNKSLIDSVTTTKVNVADIIDNLTTSVTNKPLSAKQGVAIKALIDALQAEVDSKADSNHTHDDRYYTETEINSKLDGKANASHGNHVPTTQTANNAKFLRNDNTWQTVTPANIGAAESSHGTHVSYSSTKPVMDGTASVGSASTVARSDHKHPTDTSRASKSEFDELQLIVTENTEKLNVTNIAYGTCSTAAATATKVVTISGNTNWALTNGSLITVFFSETNSAESPTLNVNGTGAKNIYYGASQITTSSLGYGGTANRVMNFMYDGTQYRFIGWGYDSNTTYTNVKLGHGYATCSTEAATTAKTATLSSYTLTTGGIVAVRFTNDVPANATLNINGKGAKAIYYRNAKITGDVIKAGDTATFIYSTYYRLISIDRWQEDIKSIQTALDTKASGSDLTSHTGNTTVHITSSERSAWNAKLDKTTFDSHDSNTTKHITSTERTNWNNAMPKSGGTFTGAVTLNADPTTNLGAATKQYVDTKAEYFEIQISLSSGVYSADKTYAQIQEAHNAGKILICKLPLVGTRLSLIMDGTTYYFATVFDEIFYQISITSANVVTFTKTQVVKEVLPNPKALTINGTSYDGSAAKSITIDGLPSVTSSNNGAFLRVVNGVWTTSTIANAEGVAF